MKKNKGITLIALVVTIVVLLILAGVSISMLTGENGIIKQAQNAKERTEIGEEKEAISVAYSGAKIKNEGKEVTANDMQDQFNYNETKANASGNIKIQFIESKRWYSIDNSGNIEGPFENEDEIVTDEVNIVISKTPESEPSGRVILKVEKVEGIGEDVILDDIDINNLSEDQKKDIVIKISIYINNLYGANYKSFNEALEDFYEGDEQLFWQELEEYGGADKYIQENINNLKNYTEVKLIPSYTVINPNNEMFDTYLATENDVYTFTIVDVITGETYEKSIEVTNVDTSLECYFVNSYKQDIFLLDKIDNPVTFEEAYIIYEGKRVDITSCIRKESDFNYNYIFMLSINNLLKNTGEIDAEKLHMTIQKIEIVKNEKSYFGEIYISFAQ